MVVQPFSFLPVPGARGGYQSERADGAVHNASSPPGTLVASVSASL